MKVCAKRNFDKQNFCCRQIFGGLFFETAGPPPPAPMIATTDNYDCSPPLPLRAPSDTIQRLFRHRSQRELTKNDLNRLEDGSVWFPLCRGTRAPAMGGRGSAQDRSTTHRGGFSPKKSGNHRCCARLGFHTWPPEREDWRWTLRMGQSRVRWGAFGGLPPPALRV